VRQGTFILHPSSTGTLSNHALALPGGTCVGVGSRCVGDQGILLALLWTATCSRGGQENQSSDRVLVWWKHRNIDL